MSTFKPNAIGKDSRIPEGNFLEEILLVKLFDSDSARFSGFRICPEAKTNDCPLKSPNLIRTSEKYLGFWKITQKVLASIGFYLLWGGLLCNFGDWKSYKISHFYQNEPLFTNKKTIILPTQQFEYNLYIWNLKFLQVTKKFPCFEILNNLLSIHLKE